MGAQRALPESQGEARREAGLQRALTAQPRNMDFTIQGCREEGGTVAFLSSLASILTALCRCYLRLREACGLPEGAQQICYRVRKGAQGPWLPLSGALCDRLSFWCCSTPTVLEDTPKGDLWLTLCPSLAFNSSLFHSESPV